MEILEFLARVLSGQAGRGIAFRSILWARALLCHSLLQLRDNPDKLVELLVFLTRCSVPNAVSLLATAHWAGCLLLSRGI